MTSCISRKRSDRSSGRQRPNVRFSRALAMLRLTERHIRQRGGGMFALAMNLLELMLVVTVVAVFSAIAYPSYRRYLDRTRVTQAVTDMKAIEHAIQQHQLINDGILPDDLAQIGMASLRDPWGNPYRYLKIGHAQDGRSLRKNGNLAGLNTDYDLYSTGADGPSGSQLTGKASRDDIVRASNGTFIGPATEYPGERAVRP